jgi:hypothetical protein
MERQVCRVSEVKEYAVRSVKREDPVNPHNSHNVEDVSVPSRTMICKARSEVLRGTGDETVHPRFPFLVVGMHSSRS